MANLKTALNSKGESIFIDENGNEVKPSLSQYAQNLGRGLVDFTKFYASDNPRAQKARQDAFMSIVSLASPSADAMLMGKAAGAIAKTPIGKKALQETQKAASKAIDKVAANIPFIRPQTQVVYHGGAQPIQQFDTNHIGSNLKSALNGYGINFTSAPSNAEKYARLSTYGQTGNSQGAITAAEIPANNTMLNLSTGYSQQPFQVQAALQSPNAPSAVAQFIQGKINSGKELYGSLVKETGSKEKASKVLYDLGIKGNYNPDYSSGITKNEAVNVLFNGADARVVDNPNIYSDISVEDYLKEAEAINQLNNYINEKQVNF